MRYPPALDTRRVGLTSLAPGTITRMEARHPHDPPTGKARKRLGQRFGALMDQSVTHLRVDYSEPSHRTRRRSHLITLVGHAVELHGPRGLCTCCPRRPLLTVDGDEVGS